MLLVSVLTFTGCSDDDGPDTYKFPSLQEMTGGQVWQSAEVTYIDGNGQEFSTSDLEVAGAIFGITFSVSADEFTENFMSPAMPPGTWMKNLYNYRFDRNTGYIYLSGHSDPYAQVISYDPDTQTIVMLGRYGEYVSLDDKDSYALWVLHPVTDLSLLENCATAELWLDCRDK